MPFSSSAHNAKATTRGLEHMDQKWSTAEVRNEKLKDQTPGVVEYHEIGSVVLSMPDTWREGTSLHNWRCEPR